MCRLCGNMVTIIIKQFHFLKVTGFFRHPNHRVRKGCHRAKIEEITSVADTHTRVSTTIIIGEKSRPHCDFITKIILSLFSFHLQISQNLFIKIEFVLDMLEIQATIFKLF